MTKVLIWVVIILGVMLISRVLTHRHAAQKIRRSPPPPAPKAPPESMVRCSHCQIYLPRSEAYMSQGKPWCCAEHAQLGLRK
ncbi:hypothetical protein KVP09_07910 [Alcaligenaceae bacterium CGII-47]|nr:hypothetical protein [Alcaligenaceae bacterium CGII-47]